MTPGQVAVWPLGPTHVALLFQRFQPGIFGSARTALLPGCPSHAHQPIMPLSRQLLRQHMHDYTFKEKAKITAGAVAALVIVLWLAVVALGILSSG